MLKEVIFHIEREYTSECFFYQFSFFSYEDKVSMFIARAILMPYENS